MQIKTAMRYRFISIRTVMISTFKKCYWASLVAMSVENPPEMWETWVQSLGWEDPLEEGMASHSSMFAWRIPTDRGAWRPAVHRVAKSWTRRVTKHTGP